MPREKSGIATEQIGMRCEAERVEPNEWPGGAAAAKRRA